MEAAYKEHEQQRKAKLNTPLEERDRLIAAAGDTRAASRCDPPKAGARTDRRQCSAHGAHCPLHSTETRPLAPIYTLVNGSTNKSLAQQTASLPDKDRRILTALINRFAAEEKLASLQRESEALRIKQKELEEREREMRRKRRQRRLLETQKAFEISRSAVRSQQASLCEMEEVHMKDLVEGKWERWQTSARLRAASQKQILEERKAIAHNKKQHQEERKHYLEWRGTLFRRALENDAKEIEYEAIMKKDAQEKWKEQERLMRSEERRRQFYKQRAQLEEQESQRQQLLKASIEERLLHAQQQHHTQLALRDAQLRSAGYRRNRLTLQRQAATREMEMNMKAWQREVDDYIRKCLLRGQEASERVAKERRLRARIEREERIMKQTDNFQRVMEEEERKRAQTSIDIEHKREICESMLLKKQTAVLKSRELARASAQLRDQVKELYLRKSFDKLALEAQMYASLDRRTHSKGPPPVG